MDKQFEQFDPHCSNEQFDLLKKMIHFYLWSFLGVLIVFLVFARLFLNLLIRRVCVNDLLVSIIHSMLPQE